MKHLILFLLPFITRSEVSKDFRNCTKLFLDKSPPELKPIEGVSVQHICQCLKDDDDQRKYLYATLYSTTWKIPIYSAYKISGQVKGIGRCDVWYIEPQLDGEEEPCMQTQGLKKNIGTNQAVKRDYNSTDYDKGHVYPANHTSNPLSMLATSTLTNVALQNSQFNRKVWLLHEKAVLEDLKTCKKAYVVAGVVPETNVKINSKITVAKFYWRATCCLRNGVYVGQGYYGPDNNGTVKNFTVKNLQNFLTTYYQITIFPSIPKTEKIPKIEYACN